MIGVASLARLRILTVAVTLLASAVTSAHATAGFVNVDVLNIFDLTSSYGKFESAIKVRNDGDEPLSEYYYAVQGLGDISVFEARDAPVVGNQDAVPHVFPAEEVTGAAEIAAVAAAAKNGTVDLENVTFFKISLPLISPGSYFTFAVTGAALGMKHPLPAKAEQTDPQLLAIENSRVLFSPYPTETQLLRLVTYGAREQELVVDPEDEWKLDNNVVEYGPYRKVDPFTYKPFKLQYESPRPVVVVNSLQRKVWISHWGDSVSFDETYFTTNMGTQLSKPFARSKFMQRQTGLNLGTAAIREVDIDLPSDARDVYYTDQVGNVSTSHFHPPSGLLQIRPRFPVFGGWHYNFTIGWSVPLPSVGRQVSKDQYIVKVPLIQGPMDVSYQDVEVSLILPEGATGIKLRPAPAYERVDNKTYSYLDTVGRPTINMRFSNLIDAHRVGDLYVTYELTETAMFTKPLSITAFFTVVFAVIIALSKVDLSIGKKKKE